jgi:16S rRNA (cytosine1402-N4)-methyltransferase
MNKELHIPVMQKEVVHYLTHVPGGVIVDATMNGGGHTIALLESLSEKARVIGIEWDPDIFHKMEEKKTILGIGDELTIVNKSYTELPHILQDLGIHKVDGALFDLGISSWHVDGSQRGFTFQKDQLLDMRFHPNEDRETAAGLLNRISEESLADIFNTYGEEGFAERIAKAIVLYRRQQRILSTFQLIEVIRHAVPAWYTHQKRHFATKVFQALRIAVNGELENVASGIEVAISALHSGGRICVISFHSLEDRIVKNLLKAKSQEGIIELVEKKAIKPAFEEVKVNPRARSAKLRVAQKI